MKQNTDTKRRPPRLFTTALALAAVGVAVLFVGISTSGQGTNAARYRAGRAQPAPTAQVAKTNGHARTVKPTPAATSAKSPAPKTAAPASAAIPQNSGGDSDFDNNGGPSDGDGNI